MLLMARISFALLFLVLCGLVVLVVVAVVIFLIMRNRRQPQSGGVRSTPPPFPGPPQTVVPTPRYRPEPPGSAAPPPPAPPPPMTPAPSAPTPSPGAAPSSPLPDLGAAPPDSAGTAAPSQPAVPALPDVIGSAPPAEEADRSLWPVPLSADDEDTWSGAEFERGWDEPLESAPAPESAGERLSFTAAYPSQVVPDLWQTLLVVLHTPGAADQVADLLDRRAREFDGAPTRISTEATAPVRRGTTVTLVPTVAGVEFNPARLDVAWHEDVQESTFRMRTGAGEGTALYGAVEVFIGPLLIALVPIGLRVVSAGTTPVSQPDVTQHANILDRIFVSYSRRDADVVRACTALYRALGVQILMDTRDLRSGQDWRESLHRLISDADLFQLYWSSASAASGEVEHEWRYAYGLATSKGGGFIRPLYWESPMPQPPAELSTIHFSHVDLDEVRSLDVA